MEISLQPTLKKKNKVNLPNEVIESNILTRLPVKTLLRFRTACKSWHSIISDPCFINIHHQNQIKKTEKPNLLLVDFTNRHGTQGPSVITDCCFPPEQSWSSFNDAIDFPPDETGLVCRRTVLGSCGGLVCVDNFYYYLADKTTKREIRLWNPALRISKVIPFHERNFSNHCMGFGYHNQTNDYNVIVFSKSSTLKDVEIYSLNLDSWRTINLGKSNDQLLKDIDVWTVGVFVSCFPRGAYFWLAEKWSYDDNGTSDSIEVLRSKLISFDMEDEQFKEIMLPYDSIYHNTIFMYKNALAVLHTYLDGSPDNRFRFGDIWVMKECCDPRSWTKICSFDFHFADVWFKGVVENDLIVLLCADRVGDRRCMLDPVFEDVMVVDLDKSRVSTTTCLKIISFLTNVRRLNSFTESLTGLTNFDKSKAA